MRAALCLALLAAPVEAQTLVIATRTDNGRADTATVLFTASGVVAGIPYGLAQQPVTALGGVYTYSLLPQHTGVLRDLADIKRRGAGVHLNLTNSGACAKDAGGVFRVALWKACFDANGWADATTRARIAAYGDSGTIRAIYVIDEPNHASRWGPPGSVTQRMVEEMAAHSKTRFPRIPTVVRAAPDWLAAGGITYTALDGAWAAYKPNRGTPEEYRDRNLTGAAQLGLWLVFSLNAWHGGTTDPTNPLFSGWVSGTDNRGNPLYAMSPAELLAYGTVFITARPCAFSLWDWRDEYLSKPGVRAALDSLGRAAAAVPGSCR